MNTLERRQIIKNSVVDAVIAKAALNKSRRERAEAARKLRKALAAKRYAVERASAESFSHYGLS